MEIIRVKNLSKAYGEIQAVSNLNLSASRGEVLGLLGANGAGKSTAVECILGTRAPDSGEVVILGMSPHRNRKKLFQRIGVQFQDANYQEKIRVAELCEATGALYRSPAECDCLLRQFGLADKKASLVSELSGGQRQKLFIVLALLPNPEVVFLDELTTGLDTKARRSVWRCLSDLKSGGLTIVLTSHFMDEVEALCDRICILSRGKTAFSGTVAQAIETSRQKTFEDAYLWYSGEEEDDEDVWHTAKN